MIHDYILNEMNEDELRNYAHHQNDIENIYGELVYALNEQIDILQRLYNAGDYSHSMLRSLNLKRDNFVRFENEMREKYEYAEPRPVCTTMGETE